jgi:hypothetical protein
MKTDEQIRAVAVRSGHIEVERLQLEVLLDIRRLLSRLPVAGMSVTEATGYLKAMAEGKPKRKKKAAKKPGP